MSALLDEVRIARQLPPPKRARAIREAAGVSQERLGRALGVHRVTVNHWESGRHRPRGEQLTAYLQLLRDLERATSTEEVADSLDLLRAMLRSDLPADELRGILERAIQEARALV